MKIISIVGARPQFIKASLVSKKLREKGIKEILVHTGQHYDFNMSDVFFTELELPKPDYYLGIGSGKHGEQTGKMLIEIEKVLLKEKPDIVMVYGDTNSTLAGAIAASKLHIIVAHVEAGLRSFNMNMPEEINRILTDRVSTYLFCPTTTAVENLKKEGFPFPVNNNKYTHQKIVNVGDVMFDAAIYYKQFAKKPDIKLQDRFILSTIHRAENTDNIERLKNIIEALEEIAKEKQIILPLHPRTRKIIKENSIKIKNITITEPVSYLEMIYLLDNCDMVITDSGGLQKEAFFFKKPCITLRDETEWIELMENRFNVLTGANKDKIFYSFKNFDFSKDFDMNLYGDGRASRKIVGEIG